MGSFMNVYKHMFSGQLAIRLFSFLLNFALLRLSDPSLLGFFNVKMTLLYNTICFLSREPVRKLCLASDFPIRLVPLYAAFSPAISVLTTLLCTLCWASIWQHGGDLGLSRPVYLLVLTGFSASALLETFVEPLIIQRLRTENTAEYARNNAILVLTQKVIAFVAVLVGLDPVFGFTIAQMLGSLLFVGLYIRLDPSVFVQIFRDALSANRNFGFDPNHSRLLATFVLHSVLKQGLTDGANFLMTFTDLLTLKMQAVYDAVDRLASLVVRLLLQPFEESAAIYFGTKMSRGGHAHRLPRRICVEFLLLTRLIITLGLVVLAFGSGYCWMAAYLYGGTLFLENRADELLFWYSLYLPVIAVNGISECFAVAMLSANQVLSHASFFLASVAVHLPLSFALCRWLNGPRGFVLSNIALYLVRVLFNWRFIHRAFRVPQLQFGPNLFESVYRRIVPGTQFLLVLLFSWITVSISYNLFGTNLAFCPQLVHLCVGVAMFGLSAMAFRKLELAGQYDELTMPREEDEGEEKEEKQE